MPSGNQAGRVNPVGCFWDYRNLPASTKFNNAEVGYAAAFRELGQKHGTVTVFRAYLEVDTLGARRKAAFHSMSITLIDCPHRAKKEVVDKMMIDMILFAIDNHPPATVIVASSDRDYSYAIATLRLRQYDVILLTSDDLHPSMVIHSTPSIDWIEFKKRAQTLAAMTPRVLAEVMQAPIQGPSSVLTSYPRTESELARLPGPISDTPPLNDPTKIKARFVPASRLPRSSSQSKSADVSSSSLSLGQLAPCNPVQGKTQPLKIRKTAKAVSAFKVKVLPHRNPFADVATKVTSPVVGKPTTSTQKISLAAGSDEDVSIADDFAYATNVDWEQILPAGPVPASSTPFGPSEYEFDELPFAEQDWAELDKVEKFATGASVEPGDISMKPQPEEDTPMEGVQGQAIEDGATVEDGTLPASDYPSMTPGKRRRGSTDAVNIPATECKRPRIYEFTPLVNYIRNSLKSSADPPRVSDVEDHLSGPQGLALCRLLGYQEAAEYINAATEAGVIFPVEESGILVLTESP